ncbi:MAG: AAA family ATPase [Trueperaceae bacterium]|nr:AAA family ATPase [Trueperaceae bacterium]MCO5174785.1 AAA family ATPase [Trueperaceae bacterium]
MHTAVEPEAKRPAGRNPAPDSPSPYQRAVFEHVEKTRRNGLVMATAGSGKTTTLVGVARRLPPGTRACFLAFNRSTAAELRARLPPGVEATTIHALGRAALVRSHPAVANRPPAVTKYRRLALVLLEARAPELASGTVADFLATLADFARIELVEPTDAAALMALATRYGLESPVPQATLPDLVGLLAPLLAEGRHAAASGEVDFTDMVYLPATDRHPLERYDFACVDEAQDLSRMSLELVLRLVDEGARALFVGDPRQAIYAFAGADRRSLERVGERTGATVLPLSVSYRCPVRHVMLARRFAPEMEPAPGAGPGTVRFGIEGDLARGARPGDLVLSRVNAPLLRAALALAEAGVPARVLGEEIVDAVLELARTVFGGAERLPAAAVSLVERHASEEAAHLERQLLTSSALPARLTDSADAHHALALLLRAGQERRAERRLTSLLRPPSLTFAELEALAHDLLAREGVRDGVLLSTIHKAKGREAERVLLLRPESLGIAGKDAADEEAEANVLFVALTRAKREYVFLEARRGAVAERLRRQARTPPTSELERRWNGVLKLAGAMARSGGRSARRPSALAAARRRSYGS